MGPGKWQRLKDILGGALAVPPGEQVDFLKAACGDDRDLFEEILTLLRDQETLDSFLENGISDGIVQEEESYRGQRFGPYDIEQRIGSGGMGAVYLAERADGAFRKQVAIKVIKHGLNSKTIHAPFS